MTEKFKIEKIILEELNNIIKEMGEEIYFNFGGPQEQNICLEKIDDLWYVYFVERGMKHRIQDFETLYAASINVIDRLSETNEIYEEYKGKFENILRRKW